mgnify:CR=1 FL=1
MRISIIIPVFNEQATIAEVLARVRAEDASFLDGVVAGLFTVPGDGCVDFAGVLSRLSGAGYGGWLVVEAEQDPARANPLDYARQGYEFLTAVARRAGLLQEPEEPKPW